MQEEEPTPPLICLDANSVPQGRVKPLNPQTSLL